MYAAVDKMSPDVRFGFTTLTQEEVVAELRKACPERRFTIWAYQPCPDIKVARTILRRKIKGLETVGDGLVRVEPVARSMTIVSEVVQLTSAKLKEREAAEKERPAARPRKDAPKRI